MCWRPTPLRDDRPYTQWYLPQIRFPRAHPYRAGCGGSGGPSKWPISAQGAIDLHSGVALFDRPFIFTPTHIITERQQPIDGDAVFDWLIEGCYRMPRSEVFGRDVRGKDAQIFARDIDIEESPIAVLGHGTWVVAVVEIDPTLGAEVHPRDRAEWPDRFGKALKVYQAGPSANLEKIL